MLRDWPLRIITFAVWAAVAASAVAWGLRFSRAPAAPPATQAMTAAPVADLGAISRLLGAGRQSVPVPAPGAQPALAGRFVLHGIIAGTGKSSTGLAVISVDGKPPRPYPVGARIDDGVVLQSVAQRQAVIAQSAQGPVLATLEIAARR